MSQFNAAHCIVLYGNNGKYSSVTLGVKVDVLFTYCNPISYSRIRPSTLLSRAQECHSVGRETDKDPDDASYQLLFKDDIEGFTSSIEGHKLLTDKMKIFTKGYEQDLIEKLIGSKIKKIGSSPHRDLNCMTHYLAKNAVGLLPKLPGINVLKFLPAGGAPLNYHLLSHTYDECSTSPSEPIAARVGWQFPSDSLLKTLIEKANSVDYSSMKGVDALEFTLGHDPKGSKKATCDIARTHIRNMKERFPANVVSFDVESVQMMEGDKNWLENFKGSELDRTGGNWNEGSGLATVRIPIPKFGTKGVKNFPARIILGDGVHWMLSIRFPIEEDKDPNTGDPVYKVSLGYIHEDQIKFLNELPTLLGLGVMNDRQDVQDVLHKVFGIETDLPCCLELDSLGLASGLNMTKTNMFTMNLVINGGLLNKLVSMNDGHWARKWIDLGAEFRSYCLMDVRFGYVTFIILICLLIRNIFPDPDVVCSTLELNQRQMMEFFVYIVVIGLSETKLNPEIRNSAVTRKDLCLSLRAFTKDRMTGKRKMMTGCVERIVAFSELLPDWANVTHGGPTRLAPVRAKFVSQYHVLKNMDLHHTSIRPNLEHVVGPELTSKITFNRGVDLKNCGTGTVLPGLQNLPALEGKVFTDALDQDILVRSMAKYHGQRTVDGILEWARLNPHKINPLLQKLDGKDLEAIIDPPPFWLTRTYVYERIRNMHFFLFNEAALVVAQIENRIRESQARVELEALSARNRSAAVYKNHCARENLLRTMDQERVERPMLRTGTQQRLFSQVPGDNWERNRKWKLKHKARKAKAKRLGNYYPKDTWREMGRRNLRHIKYARQMDLEQETQVDMATRQAPSSERQAVPCNMDDPHGEVTWEACEDKPQALLRPDTLCLAGRYTGVSRGGGYHREVTVTRQIPVQGRQVELDDTMENLTVTRQVCLDRRPAIPSTSGTDPRHPNYQPAGYESSEDEIDNDYVTSRMIDAGIYPKRKRSGFDRY